MVMGERVSPLLADCMDVALRLRGPALSTEGGVIFEDLSMACGD